MVLVLEDIRVVVVLVLEDTMVVADTTVTGNTLLVDTDAVDTAVAGSNRTLDEGMVQIRDDDDDNCRYVDGLEIILDVLDVP